jgi:hypothetical protein
MKFPITRESLQAFDSSKDAEELFEEEIQKHHNAILDSICFKFKRDIELNSKERRFVWRELHTLRIIYKTIDLGVGSTCKKINIDHYLPRFIEKLNETFIGCDIIVDPLKTYLIIDWS